MGNSHDKESLEEKLFLLQSALREEKKSHEYTKRTMEQRVESSIRGQQNAYKNFAKTNADLTKTNLELETLKKDLESRNKELHETMVELTLTIESLEETRDELWGEMMLAKKIQTILLPINPSLPGYEMNVFSEPANEVGGDYYDVFSSNNQNWIAIGDVSGHGVPAGLIMMMAHTSIKSILTLDPGLRPCELLTFVNKAIAKYIRRVGEEKYMTITVFSCTEDGHFVFAGQHQQILIYRAHTNSIEQIQPTGMWIGIMDEVGDLLSDSSFSLEKDDVLLLFTDGVTEALKKGNYPSSHAKERMFGIDRLKKVFLEKGKSPVTEIRDAILDDLTEYNRPDDTLIMLLKKM